MRSRGQAALEFLSTYGFAFLIILVMVGALAYFGVLSPKKLVPDGCLSSSQLHCGDFRIDRDPYNRGAGTPADDARVEAVITNQLGTTISLTVVSAYSTGFGATLNGQPAAQLWQQSFCQISTDNGATWIGTNVANSANAQLSGGDVARIRCDMTRSHPPVAGNPGRNQARFPAVGEKVEAYVAMTYTESGGVFSHPADLEIRATLQ